MVGNMANTFFWKYNDEQHRKCVMYINVLKGLLTAFLTGTFVLMPFAGVAVSSSEEVAAAVASYSDAISFSNLAVESAELAVVKQAAALEETTVAAEAEAVAETNLAAVERESAAVAAADGPASERASLAEEQTMLGEELTKAKTHETVTREQYWDRVQLVEDTRTQVFIERTKAMDKLNAAQVKKVNKYLIKPTPWTFKWMTREARKGMTKFALGPWLTSVVTFTGFPMLVSYQLSILVVHIFFDLMTEYHPNLGGIGRWPGH